MHGQDWCSCIYCRGQTKSGYRSCLIGMQWTGQYFSCKTVVNRKCALVWVVSCCIRKQGLASLRPGSNEPRRRRWLKPKRPEQECAVCSGRGGVILRALLLLWVVLNMGIGIGHVGRAGGKRRLAWMYVLSCGWVCRCSNLRLHLR